MRVAPLKILGKLSFIILAIKKDPSLLGCVLSGVLVVHAGMSKPCEYTSAGMAEFAALTSSVRVSKKCPG